MCKRKFRVIRRSGWLEGQKVTIPKGVAIFKPDETALVAMNRTNASFRAKVLELRKLDAVVEWNMWG